MCEVTVSPKKGREQLQNSSHRLKVLVLQKEVLHL